MAYTDLAKVNPNTKNPGNLTQIADLAIAFGQGAFRYIIHIYTSLRARLNFSLFSSAVEGRLHVLRPWEDAFDDIPAVKTHIEQARANLDPAKQAVSKAKHQHKSRLMILKHADPWLTGCPLAGLNQRYLKKR